MPLNPHLSNAGANAEIDALTALLDGGTLEIYDGSQPSSPDDAPTSQVLLATLTFGTPAFGSGIGGVATANPLTSELDAPATGLASWYRMKKSNGDPVADGSVGTIDANLILTTVSIAQHAEVAIDAVVLTARK